MEYRDPGQEYSVLPENRSDANEFSLPPAGESPDEDAKKEFEYESAPEEPKHRRFSKKKRALLIQAAGIITGAVLVMNSFGLDFLGSDGFFAGSGSKTTPLSPADYDIDPMPVKDSKWPTKTHIVYHLTYMVSGETFDSVSTDEEGEAEAKAWCKSVGGDFDTKILVKAKNTANGLQKSDDAIIVGDGDNPEAIFLGSGELWWDYTRDEYYEVYAAGSEAGEVADDSFPVLKNLDPDVSGAFAWSGEGSEEYIRFVRRGDTTTSYLQKGTAWEKYDPDGIVVYPSDASYDLATNTLTLTDFHAEILDVNLMGNGFKIKLVGKSEIDQLSVWGAGYAGSVTFTGSGSIVINGNRDADFGILLNAENSASALMIDREATVEAYGNSAAILIGDTELADAIFYLKPIVLTGGKVSSKEADGYYEVTVTDEEGSPATAVRFAPQKD